MYPLTQWLLRSLPARYRQDAVDAKNALWGGYRQLYYSQSGEDIVSARLLPGKSGFYVDVGANHPQRYSNTYLLYRRGWQGVNIDPNERAMRSFRNIRPRDTSVVVGIANEESSLPYYSFSDPAFNTFSEAAAIDARKRSWLTELPQSSVPVRPLKDVLDDTVPAGTRIDFLNVDTEGLDLAVLQSNDWERYAARVVAVEDHAFDAARPEQSETYRFLLGRGYSLYGYTGLTLIFKRDHA
ncbi:MAG: methyltransferase FkbM family [Parcubacteria group bacterium]|nr:methyltransferase FkbM family [Parcubacteria group bacterium]